MEQGFLEGFWSTINFLVWGNKDINSSIKAALLGLKQFLATESPLEMMENAFYFTSKALFVSKMHVFFKRKIFIRKWASKTPKS